MDANEKLAIHELLGRASYALDQRAIDQLEECFAADAVLVLSVDGVEGEPRFEGRDAIMALMRSAMQEQTDQRRHLTTNILFVEESRSAALVVSNLTLTGVEDGVIRLITSGLYRDRVRKDGVRWVIAERRIDLDMPY